jgi:hypothetical protein
MAKEFLWHAGASSASPAEVKLAESTLEQAPRPEGKIHPVDCRPGLRQRSASQAALAQRDWRAITALGLEEDGKFGTTGDATLPEGWLGNGKESKDGALLLVGEPWWNKTHCRFPAANGRNKRCY